MAKKDARSYKVELINDVFSISLTYDPVKLTALLMGIARYDEMRKQLIRKRSDKMIYLVNGPVLGRYDKVNNRSYSEYLIRLQKGNMTIEFVPLKRLTYLAEKLGLYVLKDARQLKREAQKAEKHIQDYASEKLDYSLMQFMFEALHAATGSPVSAKKREELERVGTMVDKCWGLRLAGKNSPVGLRRGSKKQLEELIKWSMWAMKQRKKAITYDTIANFLQREFEYDPILTGETLRKAISHHELDWKEMKNRKT